jgi:adenylate cyclase
MMRKFLLFVLISLTLTFCFPQNETSQLDSLKALLKENISDTSKISVAYKIVEKYAYEIIDSAAKYSALAYKLSGKVNDHKYKGLGNLSLGMVLSLEGKYSYALPYLQQSLDYFETAKNKFYISKTENAIGIVHYYQRSMQEAKKYLFAALSIRTELGLTRDMATTCLNLGNVYGESGISDTSFIYYLKAYQLFEQIRDTCMMIGSLNNLGNGYDNIKDHKNAVDCRFKALKLCQKSKCNYNTSLIYFAIADQYKLLKDFNTALLYLDTSISIVKKQGDVESLMTDYYSKATIYAQTSDYKNAYENFLLFYQLKDSIISKKSTRDIAEMETKYQTAKKEQEIILLNKDKEIQAGEIKLQKNVRNSFIGGFLLVLLFSLLLYNRFRLIRKQKKIIEKEREKSEKLLLNILPKDTAEELKEKNSVAPKFYETVTVMFSDFKGFTMLAEQMTADDLVSELNYIFRKFDEIISRYPIEKIKTIGDSYMCAGGLPHANSTNPVDMVKVSLEINRFMQDMKAERIKSGKKYFEIRIGLHTGSVVAGVVGDKKFAYDIWGDTVNIASRMESSGEAGKVNISGTTYGYIKEYFSCTYRGKIPAKNKGEIDMYFVDSEKTE